MLSQCCHGGIRNDQTFILEMISSELHVLSHCSMYGVTPVAYENWALFKLLLVQ